MIQLLLLLLAASSSVRFADVAAQAGLNFQHRSGGAEKNHILETIGGGLAWIDYDRDGWPDLYLTNGGRWEELGSSGRSVSNALFRNNRDGTFSNVTAAAGVAGDEWGMGAAAADYNNDGWADLYVCNYGFNRLYRNNGDGTFTEVSLEAGVRGGGWSSSAAFADYDGDGWLDLYVTRYLEFDYRRPPPPRCEYRGIQVHCGPKGLPPAADLLFRNKGDGTFEDVTLSAGLAVDPAYGLGAVWADLDNDGDADLYVANDSMGNFLFENLGHGSFREIGLSSGSAFNGDGKAQAGMGVASGDYDRDGLIDLFVTNFSDDHNTLYRNAGRGFFRDVSYAAGVGFESWQMLGWGAQFLDYDNDGWEDLFVANGHIYPQIDRYQAGTRFHQPKQLFRNLGGRFGNVTGHSGDDLSRPWSSRGSASADFDNDGDLDVAVNNLDGPPSLYRNEGGHAAGHWIVLQLEGASCNRNGIGARIVLQTDSGSQLREVQAGSSYQASADPRVHFGLGPDRIVSRMAVRWPDRSEQTFESVPAGRHYLLKQGLDLKEVRP